MLSNDPDNWLCGRSPVPICPDNWNSTVAVLEIYGYARRKTLKRVSFFGNLLFLWFLLLQTNIYELDFFTNIGNKFIQS